MITRSASPRFKYLDNRADMGNAGYQTSFSGLYWKCGRAERKDRCCHRIREYRHIVVYHSAEIDFDNVFRSQGSSSIQIVPALQPHAKQVDNYVRGSTWIASPFASTQLLKRSPDGSNHVFSEEEKKFWAENPEEYHAFRKSMEKEVSSNSFALS